MKQNDMFSVSAYGEITPAEAAKREAVSRVAANAPEGWIDDAINAIRSLALTRAEITADDVWNLIPTPPEPRAMGAAFTECARRGWIKKSGRVVTSKRKECHGRPIMVWEVVR